MKTFRIFRLALFTILMCLSACSGGGDEPIEPTPKPEVVKSEITIDSNIISNGLSFSNEKGEQSITFTTNENWTLSVASTTSGATWCTASATNGPKGNVTVKLSVAENTSYDNRTVSVTIKSGTVTKTFTVSQKGVDAMLVTTDKYEVSQEGGSINIEVKANISYRMEISEKAKSWITESSGRGLTSYKHTLNIAINEENKKREGEVYFKSGDKVETIKIYQAGGAILLLSENEYQVSDKGDTISVDIKSNIDFGVQMPDVDWIVDEASSRGLSSHMLKYIVSANEGYNSRSASIVFFDKNSELKDTLKIVQAQKDAIIIGDKEYEVKTEGQTIEVKLQSNVDFDISIEDDWIKQVESQSTRALVSHKLYFQIAGNESEKTRNGQIKIKDKQITETILIKQKGKEDEIPYLTFKAEAEQTLTMSKAVATLEYSIDGGKWEELGTTTVTFGGKNGDLRLRGQSSIGTASDYSNSYCSTFYFGENVDVKCTGDIRTLIDYGNYTNARTKNARFCKLFYNCKVLKTTPELPATELASYCYGSMFYGCNSLTKAPELPATELAEGCYTAIFSNCSNLTTAPKLPATKLAKNCYAYMFHNWNKLITAPELPATELAEGCYHNMFSYCTSLTTAPKLSATKLAKNCYQRMFYECTSLKNAPELPATELAEGCYYDMFTCCTNLIIAPQLPATKLAKNCYANMFSNCSSLIIAPQLPATILAEKCYYLMFEDCSNLKISPELPATKLAEFCYFWMFRNCTNLTTAPSLPATTLDEYCYILMFDGCSNLATAPELPATILAKWCYERMFSNCTNLVTAPKLPAPKLVEGCYSNMFTNCSNLTNITMLATEISARFCLDNWTENICSTGIFTKAKEMESLPKGNNGIPYGWAIKNYGEE